ncbi:hypothetical protein AA313_de0200169 [Arthrobotrys entomopaga]|nr:hypothetical protein AA313_de0200169 [Arthrobotrys entomopaga]
MEERTQSDTKNDTNETSNSTMAAESQPSHAGAMNTSNEQEVGSVGDLDSGYSSLGSVLELTASQVSQTQSRVKVIQETSASKSSKSFSAKTLFFRPKQPELILFPNAWVPDEFYRRFLDLVQLYDRPLKSKLKPKFMAWKVKVLGEDEDSKRPFIVILCDANSTTPIRKFFAKKEIRQQCEETENLPSLPVLVVTSSPTKVSAVEVPTVFGREEVHLAEDTSCGESIKIVQNGKAKMATLGGIIKIVVDGEFALCGITAGHIIGEDTNIDENEDPESEDDFFQLSDDSEIDDDDDDDGNDDGCCSSRLSGASRGSVPPLEIHVPTESEGCNYGWKKIGQVSELSTGMEKARIKNLDWSLVELTNFGRTKMNQVKENVQLNHRKSSTIERFYTSQNDKILASLGTTGFSTVRDRSVIYQPGTEPGYLKGKISLCPSFMQQSPSQELVKVYNMTWDSDWDLAVDIFDEAYVVPFEDTAAQIAECLGAEVVELPTEADFDSNNGIHLEDLRSKASKRSRRVEEERGLADMFRRMVKGSLQKRRSSEYLRYSALEPENKPIAKPKPSAKASPLDWGIYRPPLYTDTEVGHEKLKAQLERVKVLMKALRGHQSNMSLALEGLNTAEEELADAKKQLLEVRLEREKLVAKLEYLQSRLATIRERAQVLQDYRFGVQLYEMEANSIITREELEDILGTNRLERSAEKKTQMVLSSAKTGLSENSM